MAKRERRIVLRYLASLLIKTLTGDSHSKSVAVGVSLIRGKEAGTALTIKDSIKVFKVAVKNWE